MRILVCGGRDYKDWDTFNRCMDAVCDRYDLWSPPDEYGNKLPGPITIIHGGASGADSLADQWAVVNWVRFLEFPADWQKHGRAAGPIRNQQMLDEGKPDLVIAFPGGSGTADMVRRARQQDIPVFEPLAASHPAESG